MKRVLFTMLVFMAISMSIKADNDRVITFEQLPAEAQTVLKTHFADKVPLIITKDRNDYKVFYQSGEKAEFNKKGAWREIECKTSAVPEALVPEQILTNVKTSFPSAVITKIDQDRRGYDVKLNNGIELEYNKNFQVVGLDD